jgi:hypothetical protein
MMRSCAQFRYRETRGAFLTLPALQAALTTGRLPFGISGSDVQGALRPSPQRNRKQAWHGLQTFLASRRNQRRPRGVERASPAHFCPHGSGPLKRPLAGRFFFESNDSIRAKGLAEAHDAGDAFRRGQPGARRLRPPRATTPEPSRIGWRSFFHRLGELGQERSDTWLEFETVPWPGTSLRPAVDRSKTPPGDYLRGHRPASHMRTFSFRQHRSPP